MEPSYTDYSLLTLLYLSKMTKQFATINEISAYYGIPKDHLVKVVHKLTQLGFIINHSRGKNHGIKLAKTPSEIAIGEVVKKMKVTSDLI